MIFNHVPNTTKNKPKLLVLGHIFTLDFYTAPNNFLVELSNQYFI